MLLQLIVSKNWNKRSPNWKASWWLPKLPRLLVMVVLLPHHHLLHHLSLVVMVVHHLPRHHRHRQAWAASPRHHPHLAWVAFHQRLA